MDADKIKMFDELSDVRKKAVLKVLEDHHESEECIKRLKTDPDIQEYLANFSHHSTEFFINHYADEKLNLMNSNYEHYNFSHDYKYRYKATAAMQEILSKKMLIKMCEWSAGLIEIDGIETGDDFLYWSKNLFNCPFLDPVTKEELDIYGKYLRSPHYSEHNTIIIPYAYTIIRREREKNDSETIEEPEFSLFYDSMKGTGGYWLLPDIRINKEHEYKFVCHKERMRKYYKDVEEGKIIKQVPDNRPSIDLRNNTHLEEFIKKFESAELLAKHRNHVKFVKDQVHHDDEGNTLPPPYEGDPIDLTMEALDSVYEDYLFRKESGLSFEINENELKKAEDEIARQKQQIIDGRILLGEPGNLDIY